MTRALLALAAVAAAGVAATPAVAAELPVCRTELVNAAAGTSGTCRTHMIGDTRNSSGAFTRTATVEVATGSATLTLACSGPGGRTWTGSRTVSAPGAGYVGTWDDERCDATVTALVDGTTATVTSTFAYTVHWE